MLVDFFRNSFRPWTVNWWLCLFYCGVCLGLTITVKFVGIFIILVAGLNTINDLWSIYCDIDEEIVSAIQVQYTFD